MKWTGLNDLREIFLEFFVSKGHYRFDSFPLIPKDDSSLMLVNSGMAPLKKYFLGQAKVPGNRATSCQKCIRTPDIERVGKTARHGTYFEMLGNFSFADYFKQEAIAWAWEFCTETLALPVDRLHISVFEDDDEAYDIWADEIGVETSHIVRLGREDNFWEIGAGPCGPCSEIYFDRGEKYGCDSPTCGVGCDCDRYVEFWNLVFTQFISDGNGHYEPMEHGNIDTGMGLERLACIMQDVDNLFEVDTVQSIMKKIEQLTNTVYKQDEKKDVSIRVITDHIRSTVFMVGDGIGPSNEGRGYVLRRLLRRAARHGRLLGVNEPFLYKIVDAVIDENIVAYAYLESEREYIKKVVKAEEERFGKTIEQGMDMLRELANAARDHHEKRISGDNAFKLYDTFGFPLDLTLDILSEQGLGVDETGFGKLMDAQKKRAREEFLARSNASWEDDLFAGVELPETEFVGYETLEAPANIVFLAVGGKSVEAAGEGDDVQVVLDKTPFYAEGGGQVGDAGVIENGVARIDVSDCKKTAEGYYLHIGKVTGGVFELSEQVVATVDEPTRKATMRNHTSAHLLQKALIEVLGDHVHQSGSYVDAKRMRFDFSHYEAVTPEQLRQVEDIVNQHILDAVDVKVSVMPIKDAEALGAIALFGEKYGDTVRVVDIKDVSAEFCGGTHVSNTAHLGLFKILSESSVAAGIRRIESTTGTGVLSYIDAQRGIIERAASAFKLANSGELVERAKQIALNMREMEQKVEQLTSKMAGSLAGDIEPVEVGPVKLYVAKLPELDAEALRQAADNIRSKDAAAVAVLASVKDDKVTAVVALGKQALANGLKAGIIVKAVAEKMGGSGGGKPELAMAGAKDVAKLDDALAQARDIVASMLE